MKMQKAVTPKMSYDIRGIDEETSNDYGRMQWFVPTAACVRDVRDRITNVYPKLNQAGTASGTGYLIGSQMSDVYMTREIVSCKFVNSTSLDCHLRAYVVTCKRDVPDFYNGLPAVFDTGLTNTGIFPLAMAANTTYDSTNHSGIANVLSGSGWETDMNVKASDSFDWSYYFKQRKVRDYPRLIPGRMQKITLVQPSRRYRYQEDYSQQYGNNKWILKGTKFLLFTWYGEIVDTVAAGHVVSTGSNLIQFVTDKRLIFFAVPTFPRSVIAGALDKPYGDTLGTSASAPYHAIAENNPAEVVDAEMD